MNNLTAICPKCDNVIDMEDDVQVGDLISCTNFPCFWEGTVDEIDDGNVWFEEEDKK